MSKRIKFGIALANELIDKLDKRCKELNLTRSRYIEKLVEADFAESGAPQNKGATLDLERVAKMEPVMKAQVMAGMKQEELDKLAKIMITLGNGVEMPGTYVDIYNLGPGDVLTPPRSL